jgi:ribosomal protein RSM22 (predicted rRNA methylase)
MPNLPEALARSLTEALNTMSLRALVESAEKLSQTYRESGTFKFRTEEDCLAYAATRLPATYSALASALSRLQVKPQSLLDLGSGPGTSAWACAELFGALDPVTLVERDSGLAALGRRLNTPCSQWVVRDLREIRDLPPHDLVIMGYSLGEIPDAEQAGVIDRAWAATRQALVMVEPGTPAGFDRIRRARRRLAEQGAQIAAPCPQSGECPVQAPDWCHFAVRVQRSREHRLAKHGDYGYEDEKFSYVIVQKELTEHHNDRIIRHPQVHKGLIELRLCTTAGLENARVTKKDPRWRSARKARWGDAWPPNPALDLHAGTPRSV